MTMFTDNCRKGSKAVGYNKNVNEDCIFKYTNSFENKITNTIEKIIINPQTLNKLGDNNVK
jgi:hypothetical protein